MSSWSDWAQDRRIRETQDEIAAVAAADRSARNRLAAEMADKHGDLQSQIDRLTKAFVAMVEYEDIRGELNGYADAAAVRRYARSVIAAMMAGGFGLSTIPVPADVPGYWLHPAARGLSAAAQGSMAEVLPQLDQAERRDPHRTAVFLMLIDAITRQPRWTDRHLDTVLPSGPEVDYAQRCLWHAIAEGRLGDDARGRLRDALAEAVGDADPAGRLSAWLAAERSGSPTGRLAALRAVVERAADPGGSAEPAAYDGSAEPAPEDPLATALVSLVDEGAPDEKQIIDRMQSARAEMGFVDAERSRWVWDRPHGTVTDLLVGDLTDDAAPPHLHRLALDVLTPAVASTADALREEAAVAPAAERTVTVAAGEEVTVADGGATDDGWLDRLGTRLAAQVPLATWRLPVGGACLVACLAGLALMLVDPRFVVLGVAAAIAGIVLLVKERRLKAQALERRRDALTRSERTVAETASELKAARERYDADQVAADADRAAIAAATTAPESSCPE